MKSDNAGGRDGDEVQEEAEMKCEKKVRHGIPHTMRVAGLHFTLNFMAESRRITGELQFATGQADLSCVPYACDLARSIESRTPWR